MNNVAILILEPDEGLISVLKKHLKQLGRSLEEVKLLKTTSVIDWAMLEGKGFNSGLLKSENIKEYRLTPKQFEVLCLWCKGHSYKETALKLNRTENTVRSHVKRIYEILDVNNKSACIYKAKLLGLIS